MHVSFLLFDGFSGMVLSCLLEPLRAVRDRGQSAVTWQILTPDNRPVSSSSGLFIAPDAQPEAVADLLIVVAGYEFRGHAAGAGVRTVAGLVRRSHSVVAADTGPWLLAAAGCLDGRRATIHWSLLPDFAEEFPRIEVLPDDQVSSGRFQTCGGASAALGLMLSIIADRFGQEEAFFASSLFLHDAQPQRAAAAPGPSQLAGLGSPRLRRIVDLMVERLEDPPPLCHFAASAGISMSKLDRLFRADTGMPPGRFFRMLRMLRARDLAAETDLTLHEIALRCGFCDAPALSKAFRRSFGQPIRDARQTQQRLRR